MAEKRLFEILRRRRGISLWKHSQYVRGREKADKIAERTKKSLGGDIRVREAFLAEAKYIRMSPQKVRLVIDLIRHRNAQEAIHILRTTKKRATREVWKVLHSAIANAEQKAENVDVDRLYVSDAQVGDGPRMKRWRPVSRGMAHPYQRRLCRITVAVAEKDTG